jgi:ribosomal protein S27E
VKIIGTKVKCPMCKNKRLMDMISAEKAELVIKCPICKNIIHLSFNKNKIKAKAV